MLAVYHRARVLRVLSHARWTKNDDRNLRELWGERTLRGISARLGRTTQAVFHRAQKIGLSLGCPDGAEYLTHSAERTGYSVETLRMILDRSGVAIRRTMSRPLGRRVGRPCHFVDPFEVDEAVEAWLKTEPLASAARRRGLDDSTLARRLRGVEGVPPKPVGKRHWRIPTAVIDRVVGQGRAA